MYTLHLVLNLLVSVFAPSQPAPDVPDPTILSCYTDEINASLRQQDKAYAVRQDSLDQAWSAAAQAGGTENKSAAPPYVLPIVFHLVHQNGPENISDADVQQSVDYLNQALANTDYYDPATGVNTQIQVCLAQRSPDNQPTNGINRVVSPLTNLNSEDDLQLKDLIRWAPRDYINVWVVGEVSGLGLGSGLAGYAYYPSAHGGRLDGIVMEARWLSRDEAAVGVLIHELGHYLGLRHTFDGGCLNDDCTLNGDLVCDTPPDQSTVAVPCGGSANSCSTDTDSGFATDQNDMHINYMDYGYFRCYSAFTAGQRDRMHFFLDGIRRSLTQSKGCLEPCPGIVTAAYTGGDVTIPPGTTINFINTSTNGATFRWVRGVSLLSTATNYSQTFNSEGTYRIRLVANPADPALCLPDSVEQVIRVVCPVVADFADISATVGETVTFTNSSQNGGSSTWTVGGVAAGSTTDLNYTFTAAGRYQVCLEESDGSCSEQICREVIVTLPPCEIEVYFIYNSDGFSAGDDLTFTNTSRNGGSSSVWTVNGNPAGVANNLVYNFPEPGTFEVCLTEGNGVCTRQLCRVIRVPTEPCTGPDCPGDDGCTGAFAYFYSLPGSTGSQEVTAVLPYQGNYFISIQDSDRLWVLHIREDGSIIWQTELFSDGPNPFINQMIVDDEGQLAAIGRNFKNNTEQSFMVRLEASNGNLLWAKQYDSDNIYPIFNRLFNQRRTGNYTVIGYVENYDAINSGLDRDGLFMTINKDDGSIVTGPLHYQNNGIMRFNSAVYNSANGRYYVLGHYVATRGSSDQGTFLLELDETGNALSATKYLPQQSEWDFPIGIVLEGDKLVLAFSSRQTNNTQILYLLKTDLQGSIDWVVTSSVYQRDISELISTDNGYTLMGNGIFNPSMLPFQNADLIQLDKNGSVQWARSIPSQFNGLGSVLTATPQLISFHQGSLLLAGRNRDRNQASLLRLSRDGQPAAACISTEERLFDTFETELSTQRLQFFSEGGEYTANEFFSEPGNLVLDPASCENDCPEISESCTEPFTLQFTENDAVDMGIFTTVVAGNNGLYYVGGVDNSSTYLAAITTTGDILWQIVGIATGALPYVNSLILDSSGALVGTYNTETGGGAFRVIAATGAVIWVRNYAHQEQYRFSAIHERGTGGNFIITGAGPNQESMTLLVDRGNGTINRNQLAYAPASVSGYVASVYAQENGTLYALSNVQTAMGVKSVLSAIDDDDNLLWAKELFVGVNASDIIGFQLSPAENGLLVGARINGPAGLYAQLDFSGNIITAGSIRVGSDFVFDRVVEIPPGVGLFLTSNTLKTQGFYSNVIFDPVFTRRGTEDRSLIPTTNNNYIFSNDQIIMAGQKASTMSPFLESMNLAGERAEDCAVSTFLSSRSFSTLNNVSSQELSVNSLASPFGTSLFPEEGSLVPVDVLFFDLSSCPQPCEPEICDNQIDDDNDGLTDCNDPDLATSCCCIAQPTIDLGPDTTLCAGNVLREGTDRRFTTYLWSTGSTADSIVVLEPGEYWLTVTDTCGNTASDTLTLHLRPRPLLDLGPDTTLCANAIIPLLAQDGFATYEWVDGSSEKSYTGFGAGDFWVRATDSCGRVQTDTVRVTIDPGTEINLGADTTICPGDTLVFRLTGFTDYQWSQSSFIDCFDCPEVRFAPTSDTLLLVAAEFGGGCFSSDSIRVRVIPVAGTRDSVYLCPGESILFGSETLFNSGQYLALQGNTNCPVTDTLNVFQLRDTSTAASATICQGDSLLVFDRFERAAGTYQRSFTSASGCDSTHIIDLVVLDTAFTAETISICGGDSALVFGNFERLAGNYQRLFSTAGGCDSTHQITLEVNDLAVSARQIQPACGAAAGAGEVVFIEQAGPVSIAWPDGSAEPLNDNLSAGNYAVTVTTADGCAAIANLTISGGRETDLAITATPESCPGANDGTISVITTATTGLGFSLNGGPILEDRVFTGLSPNDYLLQVFDSLGCDQSFTLSVTAASPLLLELPERIELSLGDSVTIVPNTNLVAGNISWSSTAGDTCFACPTLTFQPAASVTVTATAVDTNGCTATDQTLIIVTEPELFYVPNAFSPNGDGVNDVFRMYPGPAVEQLLSLAVYDRWGGEIFQIQNVDPVAALSGWDGQSQTGKLPSVGVYVYTLRVRLFDGSERTAAGEVLLMR